MNHNLACEVWREQAAKKRHERRFKEVNMKTRHERRAPLYTYFSDNSQIIMLKLLINSNIPCALLCMYAMLAEVRIDTGQQKKKSRLLRNFVLCSLKREFCCWLNYFYVQMCILTEIFENFVISSFWRPHSLNSHHAIKSSLFGLFFTRLNYHHYRLLRAQKMMPQITMQKHHSCSDFLSAKIW